MSKIREVKTMILTLLSDGNAHTTKEFHLFATENGLITDSQSATIRNAVFQLKKENSCFKPYKRGSYILETTLASDSACSDDLFFKSLEYITSSIKDLRRLNWVTCSDDELACARKKIALLSKLADDIPKLLK